MTSIALIGVVGLGVVIPVALGEALAGETVALEG